MNYLTTMLTLMNTQNRPDTWAWTSGTNKQIPKKNKIQKIYNNKIKIFRSSKLL